jgi:hypothetical protein
MVTLSRPQTCRRFVFVRVKTAYAAQVIREQVCSRLLKTRE